MDISTIESAAPERAIGPARKADRPVQGTAGHKTDELVARYIPIVRSVACKIYETLPRGCGIELQDLLQAGFVGLIDAARAYRPDSPVAFPVFAKFRIRGEILDSLRRLDLVSRQLRRWQKRVTAIRQELTARLFRDPSDAEVAETLGVAVSEVQAKDHWLREASSCASPGPATLHEQAQEVPGPSHSEPDSIWARIELRTLLHSVLESLPERYRRVISLYYLHELTMKEIGRLLSINESRVCQLHKGALRAMLRKLKARGIRGAADLQVSAKPARFRDAAFRS